MSGRMLVKSALLLMLKKKKNTNKIGGLNPPPSIGERFSQDVPLCLGFGDGFFPIYFIFKDFYGNGH